MKKLFAALFILALSVSVFACTPPLPERTGRPSEATSLSETVPSEEQPILTDPSEEQWVAPQLAECVDIYWSENISYSDGYNDYDADFIIPELLLDSPSAQQANEEIQSYCMQTLEEARSERDDGVSLFCYGINYDAWIYDTYLSLVITVSNDWDLTHYLVFTFDLLTNSLLESSDFAAYAGISETAFYEAVRVSLVDAYEAMFSTADESLHDDFYDQQREKTGSDENVNQCGFFIGADGEFYIHCDLYSIAGADCYENLILLTFG